MIIHPQIDPVAFRLFGWPIYWYGIMYLLSFCWFFFMGQRLLRTPAFFRLQRRVIMEDFAIAGLLGVIIGGRLGYVLFYNPVFYAAHPAQVVFIWDGGMSFHGGLIGVTLAVLIYARMSGNAFLRLIDFAAVLTPVGLGLGRLGNFINGELPGRLASPDLPWAMVFPQVDGSYRHPSPIYQALLEGVVLAAVMLWLAKRRRSPGFLVGVFLVGYGLARLFSEQFREPDTHIGLLFGNFTMGQLLSLPMLALGVFMLFYWRLSQALRDWDEKKRRDMPDRWEGEENGLSSKITQEHRITPAGDWSAPQAAAQETQAKNNGSPRWWGRFFSGGDDAHEDEQYGRISRRYKRRLRKKHRR